MYLCLYAGIGDGGNELGMGKVKEAVKAYMPKGSLIACDVAADFAITAGVLNFMSKKQALLLWSVVKLIIQYFIQ